jgi:DUF4097 and DUF4098 domain-containing protein YvlB
MPERARTTIQSVIAATIALSLSAGALHAQRDRRGDRDDDRRRYDDAQWLDDCRDRDNDRGRDERFCEVRVSGFRSRGGQIAVDGRVNGGVAVVGWDRDSVSVHARIQTNARSAGDARDIARDIRVDASGPRISSEGPRASSRESWSVSYVVYVPRRSDLQLDTHNGPVSVEDVSGRISLEAVNGPVVLRGVSGDVQGRTQNGPLSVTLDGDRWEGRGLDLETQNGPVVLSIPRQYSAHLETGTVNGPMSLDYPMTLQGRITKRISSTLGQGGPTVRVVTTNGPVVVREGR